MVIALAPALAPMLGAYIGDHFHWRYNFILLFAVTLSIFGFLIPYYPETIQEKKPLSLRTFFKTAKELEQLSNRKRSFIMAKFRISMCGSEKRKML